MPAKIETTIRNGELIAATQKLIQRRLDEFADAHRRLKTLDVSVDLDNPDKPVVEIKAPIGEQKLVGKASADNVVQAVEDALRNLQDKRAERLQDRKDQNQEEGSEERGEGISPVGKVVAAVFLAFIVGIIMLRLGYFDSVEGPAMYPVQGAVTLDGNPVPKGYVVFKSPDALAKGMPAGGAEIIDGKYEGVAWPGTVTVSISATEEVGEPDETGMKATVETIPAQYNVESTLTATIEESDANELNFDLQSGSSDE